MLSSVQCCDWSKAGCIQIYETFCIITLSHSEWYIYDINKYQLEDQVCTCGDQNVTKPVWGKEMIVPDSHSRPTELKEYVRNKVYSEHTFTAVISTKPWVALTVP